MSVCLYVFSFLSGVAALFYEITWAKMLALTFGSTTLAASAVIAGFMGGMGIGAWLYHLAHDRFPRPLFLYGFLELGIAIVTAMLTVAFYSLPERFAILSTAVGTGASLTVLRFVVVLALLVVPAALMGATFPALCTALIRSEQGVNRHLGMVYGINTVGAAVGVLIAGVFLIEKLGLTGTVHVANLINVLVAVAALILGCLTLSRRDRPTKKEQDAPIPTDLPRWVTGLVLFFSGLATLGYEIVWFRASRYLFGSSTYALTVVLFTFLLGLGFGAMFLQRVLRRGSAERNLALCQYAIAVFVLLAVLIQSLFLTVPALRDRVSIFSQTVVANVWWSRLLAQAGLTIVAMLPATLFMGLSFPLATRLFLGDVSKLGTGVGRAYLLASLGSIFGAILGAVLLLPFFGTVGGMKVLSVVSFALGTLVILAHGHRLKSCYPYALATGVAVAAAVVALPRSFTLLGEIFNDAPRKVIFIEEGDFATVQVFEDLGDPNKKAMAIDGYRIGFSAGFKTFELYRKQLLLAHLPMVLDTRITRTLNIGLGSGSTLHALASYPQLESLDCVEINGSILTACRFFDESSVLDDPRVQVIIDDAVHHLLRTDDVYDLIIADGKQQISYSGNAVLLCREFYRFALSRLSDIGLYVQWHPMTVLNSDFRTNLRTICDVFPHVDVFYFASESALIVGSRQPLAGRPRMSDQQFNDSRARSDLESYYIDHPAAFLSRWTSGKSQLMRYLEDAPLNTWDHLVLEFSAYKGTSKGWYRARFDNVKLLINAGDAPGANARSLFDLGESRYPESVSLTRRAFLEYLGAHLPEASVFAQQARTVNPEDRNAVAILEFITNEQNLGRVEAPNQ